MYLTSKYKIHEWGSQGYCSGVRKRLAKKKNNNGKIINICNNPDINYMLKAREL